jgi:DNA-binding response OmpR family regulator
MPEVSKTPEFVRFDPFELSVETGELFKNGIRVRLSGQPIQVLIRLVATPGKLVTREELQQLLWTGKRLRRLRSRAKRCSQPTACSPK